MVSLRTHSWLTSCSAAADTKPKPPVDKPAASAAEPAKATDPFGQPAAPAAEPAKATDPFVVPKGTPEELLAYIEKLTRQRPTAETPQALAEFRDKVFHALLQASEDVLAGKPNAEQAKAAVQYKLVALHMLMRTGDASAGKKLDALPAEMEKAGFKELVRQVRIARLQIRLDVPRGPGKEELAKLLADAKKCLTEAPVDQDAAGLAMSAAMAVEQSGQQELAIRTDQEFAKLLAASKEKEIAELAVSLEGAARRLGLVGKTFTLQGTTVQGKPLDWSKYKGKVVLVDFWATWCGPCIEELANIERNYKAYHARGFDVVGVSVDESSDALDTFLEKHQFPWTVVLDDLAARGTKKSLSAYYGVFGIPTVFLVGADGKVISIHARGEELDNELKKLLGPPKVKTEKAVD